MMSLFPIDCEDAQHKLGVFRRFAALPEGNSGLTPSGRQERQGHQELSGHRERQGRAAFQEPQEHRRVRLVLLGLQDRREEPRRTADMQWRKREPSLRT